MTHYFGSSLIMMVVGLPTPSLPTATKLTPGTTIFVIPVPGDGVIARTPVAAVLPKNTPYARGSADEQRYLRGFSLGYLDCVNGRLS
jgi:hypothetical protein